MHGLMLITLVSSNEPRSLFFFLRIKVYMVNNENICTYLHSNLVSPLTDCEKASAVYIWPFCPSPIPSYKGHLSRDDIGDNFCAGAKNPCWQV